MMLPFISDPLCLFDCCPETDGAVAIITADNRACRSLRDGPIVTIAGRCPRRCRALGLRLWSGLECRTSIFVSSGHRPVAKRLYDMAGLGPGDVDVALCRTTSRRWF